MALDYSRSYVTFVTKGRGNLARLQVESRCLLYDAEGTLLEEFFQYASCKSEDTFGTGVLFYEVNYDFSGVFSKEHYVIYRARAPKDENPFHERGKWADRFEDLLFQIEEAQEPTARRWPHSGWVGSPGCSYLGAVVVSGPWAGRSWRCSVCWSP